MQKYADRTFYIAPHFEEQNNKQFWVLGLVGLIGMLFFAYILGKSEFLSYAISAVVLFVFIYFQAIKTRSASKSQDWPSIILFHDKIQIRQAESLLWSKNMQHICSAEVENRTLLFFSSKALLIKSNDKDSYYLSIPKPYSLDETVESIAQEINDRVSQYSEKATSNQ